MSFKLFGSSTTPCRVCSHPVSEDASTCPKCGEKVKDFKLFGADKTNCRACGVTVSSDAEVCPNCNENLKGFKLFGADTANCRACGSVVSTDAETCPNCREKLKGFKLFGASITNCRGCGKEISTDAKQCPHCGESQTGFKLFGASMVECRACRKPVSTDAAVCPSCGEVFKSSGRSYSPQTIRQSSKQDMSHTQSEDGDLFTKIIGALIGIGLVIWLAVWLINNIVVPVFILNIALIIFITGLSQKEFSELLFPFSFFISVIMCLDYLYSLFNRSLVSFTYIAGLVPFFVYLNLLAGLIAAYLFIRNFLDKQYPVQATGEFSRRNVIVMGSLFVVAAGIVSMSALQKTNDDSQTVAEPVYENQASANMMQSTITESLVKQQRIANATVNYTGFVGNLDARYTLTWFDDGTIEGYYHYPARTGVYYVLKGEMVGDNKIRLREYTNDLQTATCDLELGSDCYNGEMRNTDGRILEMHVCEVFTGTLPDSTDKADTSSSETSAVNEMQTLSVEESIKFIKSEFQRINAAQLDKRVIDLGIMKLNYYLEYEQVVKISCSCSLNGGKGISEHYFKDSKLIFSYEEIDRVNNVGDSVKLQYRTYVQENRTIRFRINQDITDCSTCSFDENSVAYRLLKAFWSNSYEFADCFH